MKENLDRITREVIGGAIEVHRALGPGALESAYEVCLVYELGQRGLAFERQKPIPVHYKGIALDCAYRADIVVDRCVIVELKAVQRIEPVHEAQLNSYLKFSGCPVGLLINFNVPILTQGIRRWVLNYPD